MICRRWKLYTAFLGMLLSVGCYSFKGISIPPDVSTFYIDQFQNNVSNAPPDIAQRFSDEFRQNVTQTTRLIYNEEIPQVEFSGSISSFNVQSVAPERNSNAGQVQFGSTLNRLTISVQVSYVNNLDEEDDWSQSFSFFEDFENDQNLDDVQDELIDNIFEQILQDIFTRAFTNW
ncbi:MAG: hypothetical protein ACI9FN_002639 [Saprospiraceae bacterium]|jgi:hypothetical protein